MNRKSGCRDRRRVAINRHYASTFIPYPFPSRAPNFLAIEVLGHEDQPRLYDEVAERMVVRYAVARSMVPRGRTRSARPGSTARTRTRVLRVPIEPAAPPVSKNEIITSPESNLRYRIERLLGEGGFGRAYLARRIGSSTRVPKVVCIKLSARIDGWLREAYFGQLLDGQSRAIQVYDAFPLVRSGHRVLYSLALEYAPHGDLSVFLQRTTKGWSEIVARREIAGILQVLRKLHRGHMLHRDLTPMNVFVCDGFRLKLGDFGIVRQQSNGRGITARTLNALTAPSDILAGEAPKWAGSG